MGCDSGTGAGLRSAVWQLGFSKCWSVRFKKYRALEPRVSLWSSMASDARQDPAKQAAIPP